MRPRRARVPGTSVTSTFAVCMALSVVYASNASACGHPTLRKRRTSESRPASSAPRSNTPPTCSGKSRAARAISGAISNPLSATLATRIGWPSAIRKVTSITWGRVVRMVVSTVTSGYPRRRYNTSRRCTSRTSSTGSRQRLVPTNGTEGSDVGVVAMEAASVAASNSRLPENRRARTSRSPRSQERSCADALEATAIEATIAVKTARKGSCFSM